jgi:hypothetical protein
MFWIANNSSRAWQGKRSWFLEEAFMARSKKEQASLRKAGLRYRSIF